MHVDLDHAGIGRYLDHVDARIVRRRVALDAHWLTAVACDRLDRAEQFEIILQARRRRHEDAEHAVAQLDRKRGADGALGRELFVQLLRIDAGRGSVVDLAKLDRRRQRATRLQRVLLVQEGEILRLHIGQGFHWQPQADRRVAGNQDELTAPQRPALAAPGALDLGVPTLNRKHEAGWTRKAAIERAHHARALFGVVDLGIERVDVDGQRLFLEQPIGRVFVGGDHVICFQAQPRGDLARESLRVGVGRPAFHLAVGDQLRRSPDRLPVLAPIERERPARQTLARIPFALAEMQETARREAFMESPDQILRARLFRPADRPGVPFRGVVIVDRNEGRLAAHRQAHVLGLQISIDRFPERVERAPGDVGERERDARRLA